MNLSGWRTVRKPELQEPSECEEAEVDEVTGSQGQSGLEATVNLWLCSE